MRLHPTPTNTPNPHAELLYWRSGAVIWLGSVALGVLQAVLWSRIAPREQYFVSPDGTFGALPTESYHQFASIAIFALLGVVAGVGVATAVWHWRSTRGMVAALIVAAGNALGALTAYLVGAELVTGTDPASVGPTSAQSVVGAAPTLGNLLVIVVQPALAIAVYTFLVVWNGRPDLGRPSRWAPKPAALPAAEPRSGNPNPYS